MLGSVGLAGGSSYPEFPDGCLLIQLAAGEDVREVLADVRPCVPPRSSAIRPVPDRGYITGVVQDARNCDPIVLNEIKQDVGRGRRPTAQADRQFVPSPAHFRLQEQRSRLGLDLIEQPVGGLDAVLGDEKPSLEQIVFRAGGISNLAHAVATPVAVLPVLPGRAA